MSGKENNIIDFEEAKRRIEAKKFSRSSASPIRVDISQDFGGVLTKEDISFCCGIAEEFQRLDESGELDKNYGSEAHSSPEDVD
jgi:hypothetical protein